MKKLILSLIIVIVSLNLLSKDLTILTLSQPVIDNKGILVTNFCFKGMIVYPKNNNIDVLYKSQNNSLNNFNITNSIDYSMITNQYWGSISFEITHNYNKIFIAQ